MNSESLRPQEAPARRAVVTAADAAGLAAVLAGCGSGEGPTSGSVPGAGSASGPKESTGGTGTGSSAGSSGAAGPAGAVLARTADIPEGGGKVFAGQGVVVTQPEQGRFMAFSARCTHQGCTVGAVADGVISCPCHRSEFSAADGSVRKGPATRPLPARDISVSGDRIRLA
ncbi:Rieske (2Fe-2S) protein [Streptomyces sp. NPDC047017]|uniref:Rieske (2Fe-2S) protein n=1 Tax=Streptomyces sp. NPDC047017 TaxID=3155024 RepID=UPI003403DD41